MRALRSRIISAFAVTAALTWTFGCGSSSPPNSNSGSGGSSADNEQRAAHFGEWGT